MVKKKPSLNFNECGAKGHANDHARYPAKARLKHAIERKPTVILEVHVGIMQVSHLRIT
jgi:hypothetical protein